MITKSAQPMAPTVSPRTQMMGVQPSGDDETRMFEDGFSQMAYSVLVAKFPDLMPQVITFKVLDTDVDTGAGVGAFVLQHNDDVVYIPVVMADNQLKPLDMFYHKNLNVFLPLSNDWLDEVAQLSLDEMGEAVAPPKTLRRDVDIRNMVIPPTTGRYAYAAAKVPFSEDQVPGDLLQMIQHSQEKTAEVEPLLPQFLAAAPDQIKVAFNRILRSNKKLAAQVTQLYGLDRLAGALKVSSATSPKGGALYVVDKDTPESEFKRIFGDRAAEAFQGVLLKGYDHKESRGGLRSAVQVQKPMELHTPSESGFYEVYTESGDVKPAFVLHNPRSITGHGTPEGRHGKRHDTLHFGEHNKSFVVVMNGGQWVRCHKLIGKLLDSGNGEGVDNKKSDVFNKLMMGDKGDTPTAGSRGIFVQKKGKAFIGTEPFRIDTVSTDGDGVRRIRTMGFPDVYLVTDKKAAKAGMHQPKGSNIMYIPPDARFIKLNDDNDYDTELLKCPTEVGRWFHDKFDSMGAGSFTVKNAGAGLASIDGEPGMPPVQAMKEAALRYHIHFTAAENLVKQAMQAEGHGVKAYILTPEMNEKIAQTPMMDPSSQMMGGAPPPGGAPMDPSMQGAAPPPAPPSPLDIAMGEAQTQIQQQMADLEQQAMALQDKAQTLGMVQQRAQEMAAGGAPAVGMGAPPMPPPGMGAPQGAPQGAPPQPMAGGMGGVPSPAPMGGMTGQEQMQPMGPGAMMATETPSASEIQNQVNPQFLEQAGQLGDTGAFDAAAIGSMAQSPSFRDMVTDYVPTLERALDNLGRILLTMWMQEAELKEQIGEEQYVDLEDNIRAVFEGLGELVLSMNRNAIVMEQQAGAQ
jgi:hypothetical protein